MWLALILYSLKPASFVNQPPPPPFHLIHQMLPLSTNIRDAYKNGKEDEQNFIQNLALFLCTFLREHGVLVEEKQELQNNLLEVSKFSSSPLPS